MSMYRLKFELENGMKIYASRNGKIDRRTKAEFGAIKKNTFSQFGYSSDLSVFGTLALLNRLGKNPIKIKRAVIESCDLPIDKSAKNSNLEI